MMIEFITDQDKYRIKNCQRLVQFEMLRLDKYPRGIKYKSTYTQTLLCLNQRRPAPSRPPRGPCSCRGRCPPASPRPSPRPCCCCIPRSPPPRPPCCPSTRPSCSRSR